MTTLTSLPTKATTTIMGRLTRCDGCGHSQWTVTSYYLDRKEWNRVHTLDFCRERKARIAQLDFTKVGNYIRNQEILNSLN
jgi:hypothetical protein